MKRKEKQYKKQDQIFTTYQRKPRKYKQDQSQSALEDEEHMQALGSQEEDPAAELGQDIQDPDEVIKQVKRINLFLDQQEKEKEKHLGQELPESSASLFSEQQAMEGEKEDSAQEHEEFGIDTNSEQLPIKMKKRRLLKSIKRLRD